MQSAQAQKDWNPEFDPGEEVCFDSGVQLAGRYALAALVLLCGAGVALVGFLEFPESGPGLVLALGVLGSLVGVAFWLGLRSDARKTVTQVCLTQSRLLAQEGKYGPVNSWPLGTINDITFMDGRSRRDFFVTLQDGSECILQRVQKGEEFWNALPAPLKNSDSEMLTQTFDSAQLQLGLYYLPILFLSGLVFCLFPFYMLLFACRMVGDPSLGTVISAIALFYPFMSILPVGYYANLWAHWAVFRLFRKRIEFEDAKRYWIVRCNPQKRLGKWMVQQMHRKLCSAYGMPPFFSRPSAAA